MRPRFLPPHLSGIVVLVAVLIPGFAVCLPLSLTSQPPKSVVQNRRAVAPQKAPAGLQRDRPAQLTLRADNLNPLPGQSVHFAGTWSDKVYRRRYRFEWGDGQSTPSDGPEADYAYPAPGVYVVRLFAFSASPALASREPETASNQLTVVVAARVLPPVPEPEVTLRADRPEALVGEPVRFVAIVSPPSVQAHFQFVFGDGHRQNSLGREIEYSYAREGEFQPWVSASIDGGNRTVTSAPIRLTVGPAPTRPIPRLNVEPLSTDLVADEDVQLRAWLDPPQDGARYQFRWGDGSGPDSAGADGVGRHRYARPGSYTVLVTASTVQRYPAPLEQTVVLVISQPAWSPTLGQLLLALIGGGAVFGLARWLVKPKVPAPPAEFHITGFTGSSVHQLASIDRPGPHLSLTLRPGVDSAAHEVVFPKRAAASDPEEHRA